MTETSGSNLQTTSSKDSWAFWIFFVLWLIAVFYLLSIRASVDAQPDSIFWGYQGLRRLDEVTAAVRFFQLLQVVGIFGSAISLSFYAYQISGKKIAYALMGLLGLLSPLLGVIGYFIARMQSKS